jgi:hypothetical protein
MKWTNGQKERTGKVTLLGSVIVASEDQGDTSSKYFRSKNGKLRAHMSRSKNLGRWTRSLHSTGHLIIRQGDRLPQVAQARGRRR